MKVQNSTLRIINSLIQKLENINMITQTKSDDELQQQYGDIIKQTSTHYMIYKSPLKTISGSPKRLSEFMTYLNNIIFNSDDLKVGDQIQAATKVKMKQKLQK